MPNKRIVRESGLSKNKGESNSSTPEIQMQQVLPTKLHNNIPLDTIKLKTKNHANSKK